MARIIPKTTKHALSFRLKTSKTKALKQFRSQIKAQAYIWKSECYEFNLSSNTRAWLPGAHTPFGREHQGCSLPMSNRSTGLQGKNLIDYGVYKHTLFGRHGIVFDVYGSLTAKFLETTRMEVAKIAKKARFWLRLCCQTPMTARPAETRMGKGKGAISHWETRLRPGQIWFEFAGLSDAKVSQILIGLQKKSPFRIRLIGMANHTKQD